MRILIIDGQGGKLGKQLVEKCMVSKGAGDTVIAVGTNAIATANMLKANPDEAATGENAIVVCARKADVICGPAGIVIADAMNGEVTPAASCAVGQSDARRILIPMNRCDTVIVGVKSSLGDLAEEAAAMVFAG
jgi:hypothetical protein